MDQVINPNTSTSQTKSNLWIAVMIFASIFIVGVILYFVMSLIPSFSYQVYLLTTAATGVIIWLIVGIFAPWLGVKLIRRKTGIDPKNYLRIPIYVAIITSLLFIGFIYYVVLTYGAPLNWWLVIYYFISLVIFDAVLIYYFISKSIKVKYIAIILGLIVLLTAILQGYVSYQAGNGVSSNQSSVSKPLFS